MYNKSNKTLTNQQIAFEKYLNLVTQLYYQKSTPEIKNDDLENKIKSTRGRKAKNVEKTEEVAQQQVDSVEEKDIQLSIFDSLISPIRKQLVFGKRDFMFKIRFKFVNKIFIFKKSGAPWRLRCLRRLCASLENSLD